MVDVEEGALRAFEKNFFPLLQSTVQINDGVGHKRPQLFSGPEICGVDFAKVDRSRTERFQDVVIFANLCLQFFGERRGLHEIGNTQAGSGRLVAVGGPNSALGRADLRAAFPQFALLIEDAVIWQNKMCAIADDQIFAHCNPEPAQAFDLVHQRERVDNYPIADHADFATPQNPRRNQMQNVFPFPVNDGVTGVIAALTAHHDICVSSEDIDDFPFTFVAPLRPN